jgi:transketolase
MRSYGASAPLKDLQREFGFSADRIAEAAREQLKGTAAKK